MRSMTNYLVTAVLPDVHDGLLDLVCRADHLRVRLEVALRGDHLHELFGHVDVRAFERARLHETEAGITGLAAQRLARGVGLGPLRIAELLQALRVREVRDRDLPQRLRV